MQAVILVAGRGTRLMELTKDIPKCLLEVEGTTTLKRQLQVLSKRCKEIILVVGYKKEKIINAVEKEYSSIINPKCKCSFVVNNDYEKTNSQYSLWLAGDKLNDDIVILDGDILFDERLIDKLIENKDDMCMVLSTDWTLEKGFKVEVKGDSIKDISRDVPPAKIYGENAGIFKVKKPKLDLLKKIIERMIKESQNHWFEDSFIEIAKKEKVGYIDVAECRWHEFDTMEEYEIAKKGWKELLMLPGPTEIEKDILEKGAQRMMYFRSNNFLEMTNRINKNLQYVFQTKNPVYTIVSSGTGAMEFAVANVINSKDTVLVINNGVFADRWKRINEAFGVKVINLEVPFGETVTLEQIKDYLSKNKVNAVFATMNETSTGVLTDIKEIAEFLKPRKELFFVDAISSLAVEELKMDEWGCDVVVTSSQKGFGLPPGLAFVALSKKAHEKAKKSDLPKFYFKLSEYDRFHKNGSHPYTPNITLLYQLDTKLEKIREMGLENYIKKYKDLTKKLRNSLEDLGLKLVGPKLANCVTAVLTPDGIDATDVIKTMKEKYNIALATSHIGNFEERKKPSNKMFRIANFGDVDEQDINRFVSSLQLTLEELKQKNNTQN